MSLTFFIVTISLMISNLVWIIFFTPMVPEQEWAQKIFYLHVPIAWSGFLAYFIVMVSGICFLFTKNLKYDRIGLATPIWGKPWVWEPRLITTLVLFLIYIGYFIMRNIGLYRQRAALVCSVIGIIAFLDIPIIFASVNFWAAEIQSHPQLGMNKQPSGILNPFLFSLLSFTTLMILMLLLKIEVLKNKDIGERYV